MHRRARPSISGTAPWCAAIQVGSGGVHYDCYYATVEACTPNVLAGNRGFCAMNPYFGHASNYTMGRVRLTGTGRIMDRAAGNKLPSRITGIILDASRASIRTNPEDVLRQSTASQVLAGVMTGAGAASSAVVAMPPCSVICSSTRPLVSTPISHSAIAETR